MVKAIEDPKQLRLAACLNHQAVAAYVEWCLKARESAASNVCQNLTALVSVCKFLLRSAPKDATVREVLDRYRTMRNRLSAKGKVVRKTEAYLTEEGRWLSKRVMCGEGCVG